MAQPNSRIPRFKHTRIDMILKYQGANLYMVGECKRVNPALGNWCFSSGSQQRLSPRENDFYVEVLEEKNGGFFTTLQQVYRKKVFHVGIEVKTDQSGDSGKSGRGGIEEACTQVLRGMNGLVKVFIEHPEIWRRRKGRVGFVPVIFTTAKLYASSTSTSARLR